MNMKIRINKNKAPMYFFAYVFSFAPIVVPVVRYAMNMIGLSDYSGYVLGAITIILLMLCGSRLIKYWGFKDIILYPAMVGFFFLSGTIHQNTIPWIEENAYSFIITVLPYIFVGILIGQIEIDYGLLFKICRIGILIILALSIASIASGEFGNAQMGFAYMILPLSMLITYNYVVKRSKLDFFFAFFSAALVLISAERGPVFLYALLVFLLAFKYRKKVLMGILFVIMVIILVPFIRIPLLHFFSNTASSLGLNSRIFDLALNYDLAADNGRSALNEAVYKLIKERPYFGNGLYSDRLAIKGANLAWVYRYSDMGVYVHNFPLEVICQVGYVLGVPIFIALIWLSVRSYFKIGKEKQILFIVLLLCYVFKLFFSSSYLDEGGFFMFVGMIISVGRQKKRVVLQVGRREAILS